MATEYTVLRKGSPSPANAATAIVDVGFKEFAKVTATSSAAAIRQVAREDGAYVAIPSRSWQPLTVTCEQQTKVTFA